MLSVCPSTVSWLRACEGSTRKDLGSHGWQGHRWELLPFHGAASGRPWQEAGCTLPRRQVGGPSSA